MKLRKILKKAGKMLIVQSSILSLVLNTTYPVLYAYAFDQVENQVEESSFEQMIEYDETNQGDEIVINEEQEVDPQSLVGEEEQDIEVGTEIIDEENQGVEGNEPPSSEQDELIISVIEEESGEIIDVDISDINKDEEVKISLEAASDEKVDAEEEDEIDLSGTECLSEDAEIKDSMKDEWDINTEGTKAETKDDVKLGVNYVFPLNEKVTVTFSCLPRDPEKRATLNIEQLKATDLDLSEKVIPASEYAYDITTDMENGDFEYNITLPASGDSNSEISYIEKSIEDAQKEIKLEEIGKVDNDRVDIGEDLIEISELDHFTIFLVTWNFPDNLDNAIADGGTIANLAKTITSIGTNVPTFGTTGVATRSASATGWDSGSGLKYWQVELDSQGFEDLVLSSRQYSSATGPKDFKVQYSVDGVSWVDVAAGNVTVDTNFTSGTISDLSLSSAVDDQSSVYLRWIMTSNDSVGGASVGSVGTNRIDDIIVQGVRSDMIPGINNMLCIDEDTDGANDFSGQKDLTKFCRNIDTNDPLQITWNWDEISMSGSNTADACALFDVDHIGDIGYDLADYATCVSWGDDGKIISGYPKIYSCNDTRPDGCAGAVELAAPSHGTYCDVSLSNEDPFLAGDDSPWDMQAYCSIDPADTGGEFASDFIDVCSYPSGQPGSAPSDCIAMSLKRGNLQVNKNVVPDDVSTNWDIAVSGATPFSDTLQGDDTTGTHVVDAGDYDISETAGTGMDMSQYDSTYSCLKNGSAYLSGSGTSVSGVSVSRADFVQCTFTNTLKTGTLTVEKVVINDNGGTSNVDDFSFSVDGAVAIPFEADGQNEITVDAGTYNITEPAVSGYITTYNNCSNVVIPSGGSATCTITNDDIKPKLTIVKDPTNDNGGNAAADDFNLTVAGSAVDSGVAYEYDANTALAIDETQLSGYTFTSITGDNKCPAALGGTITLDEGDDITCTITNDDQQASIEIVKNTFGGDGTFNFNVNGPTSSNPTITTVNGADSTGIILVDAGSYDLSETVPEGWDLTGLSCTGQDPVSLSHNICHKTNSDVHPWNALSVPNNNHAHDNHLEDYPYAGPISDGSGHPLPSIGEQWCVDHANDEVQSIEEDVITDDQQPLATVDLGPGETVTCIFTNTKRGNIIVDKVTTPEGSEQVFNFVTTGDGYQDFSLVDQAEPNNQELVSGLYSVTESLIPGWEQTLATCELQDQESEVIDNIEEISTIETISPEEILLNPGETVICTFENLQLESELFISKTNNKGLSNIQNIGDTILYTIIIESQKSYTNEVIVTDLPPEGFEYVSGSWTADSTIRGDLKVLGVTTEPTYASPGDWIVGDIQEGEIVILTYEAQIGSNIETSGIYPDLAWAQGTNPAGESQIALSDESDFEVNRGIVDDNFVGTQVAVIVEDDPESVSVEVDEEEIVEEVEKEVLVKGTTSPETGASNLWIILATFLLIFGISLIALSQGIKRKSKGVKTSLIFGFILAQVLFINYAFAAPIALRVEQPESAVGGEFEINYVVLDTADREVEVKCFKKGPTDSSFINFQTKTLIPGGDSETCLVGDAILVDEGVYNFKVIVVAGDDEKESDIISVNFDGIGPDRPRYIEKDEETSCRNEITFRTANDNQTSYVEVYRSHHSRDFDVDNNSKLTSINIGPGQKHVFDDHLEYTDCGDNFYYAIRAFDDAGNVSSVRVEEVEDVVEEEVIVEVQEEIQSGEAVNPNLENEEEIVAGEGDEEEVVELGEDDNEDETSGSETVLGEQTSFGDKIFDFLKDWKFWLAIIIVFALIVFLYNKKNKKTEVVEDKNK